MIAFFFFFQAEDGIRDLTVTGVQTCALPISTQTWESCVYQATDERDFVKNYLGPAMVEQGLRGVHVMVWDHNRDLIVQRAQTILDDPAAAKYEWGIAFHWYEDWPGGTQMYDNVALVHQLY